MKLEKNIEQEFVRDLSYNLNLRAIKFSDPARRGAPDRLVLLPKGRCVFFEFKKAGETLREEQLEYHKNLKALGHLVYTCHNVDTPFQIVKKLLTGEDYE